MATVSGETHGYPAKRQAILDAAAEVFLREGYTRTSVDAIAAAAGVSKQTIYNHFGDKERLLLAITSAVQDAAVEQQETLIEAARGRLLKADGPQQLREELVDLTEQWIRLAMSERLSALRNLVYSEALHQPQLAENWQRNGPRRIFPKLGALLADLGAGGVLDIPPEIAAVPERLAHQLTGSASYEWQSSDLYVKHHEMPDSAAETRAAIGHGVDFFLRAYGPR
ncbi:MAG TPA: TetR/AcrR family transcriptional regulator [Actinocrinis sp.]|jgi:TetR/AcrR family transcriptional repressor of mexJK operon